jgi:hypothetical protein
MWVPPCRVWCLRANFKYACRYAGSLETSYDSDELQPDWEIDPSTLEIGAKVGQGEFGAVHKVCNGMHCLTASEGAYSQGPAPWRHPHDNSAY